MRMLPPVRRAVPLRDGDASAARGRLQRHFGDRHAVLYGSGTQALSAAIASARDSRGLSATQGFEVIVPAYGCPDLVTACVFAGGRARLVDVAADGWGYDLRALSQAIGPRTAAILAVNLFGVGDAAASIVALEAARGIPLIHDSAQSFSLRPRADLPGDYLVLSFGRGKPVNLLGGGALLTRHEAARPAAVNAPGFRRRLLSSAVAAAAFNIVTHPAVYGAMSSLPGLGVGATRYHALDAIETWDGAAAWGRVGAGVAAYLADARIGDEKWRPMLSALHDQGIEPLREQGVGQLHGGAGISWNDRLLRLPLLVSSRERRDLLVHRLQALGASAMYALPLPSIADVPADVAAQGPFPNASRLADRLLTLPTHDFVTDADVARVIHVFRQSALQ